ncbi:nucleotide-binding universal stress UspA family protein [Thermostichus sp. MS-CIW-21]
MQAQLYRRSRPLSLTLMAVGSSWLLGSCQLRAPQVQLPGDVLPETALVPQSAPLVLALSTKPEESLRTHPDLLARWESWTAEAWASTGQEFSREEMQAWAGDHFTLAVVIPNLVPGAAEPVPGILWGASTRNADLSGQFLAQVRQQAAAEGANFEQRQEQGVTLYVQTNGEPGERWVTAEFGNRFVAVANDPRVMQQAIAVYRGEAEPIGRSESFRTAVGDLYQKPGTLAFAYFNFQALHDDPTSFKDWMPDLDPEELGSLQPLRSLAMAAHWREQGLQMRMLTQLDPQTPLLGKWQTARGELIRRLPGSALAVITTQQVAQRWQAVVSELEKDPQAKELLDELRAEFRANTRLDLDQDLMAWLDGEMALLVAPDAQAHPFLQGMGAALLVESSQKDKANAALAQLDRLAQESGARVTEAEGQVTWADPLFKRPLLVRSWEGNYLMVTTSTAALQTLAQRQGNWIPQTEPLKTLYEQLPKPNYGYFLLNWRGIRTVLEAALPGGLASLEPEARELLTRIDGLGITSYPVGDHALGLELLVTVPPKPQP